MSNALTRRVHWSAITTRTLLILLIGTIASWTLLVSPPKLANPWVISLVQILPLLLFLPAVIRGHARSHAWLCFLVLFYFIAAVLDVTTPGQAWIGGVKIVLTLGLFTSAMLYARWKSQWLAARQATSTHA